MSIIYQERLAENLMTLEELGAVERWYFHGDAVHILMREPAKCPYCSTRRWWFVNRDGRTRCCECDGAYLAGKVA